MSVTLVNGHVLIPLCANYSSGISRERRWTDEVCESEFGSESRFALSALARNVIGFRVTPTDVQQTSRLIDQILAASKSGLACAPFYGRGIAIATTVTAATLVIEATEYPLAVDDYLILVDDDGNYDVRQIDAIAGDTITLDSAVTSGRSYRAGSLVWPLLFGKFRCENLNALLEEAGEASITIAEQVSLQAATIGTAEPPIDGIGGWIIGNTFEVQ
jgi:hypothetical protein